VVQVVTLTGALTDTGEYRVTTVGLGDVVDELLDEHSLADTGTAEETDLATTSVWGEEVDDLNTGLEDLGLGGLVDELGGVGVDGRELDALDLTTLVDGLTDDIHDTTREDQQGVSDVETLALDSPEGSGADGDLDGGARVDDLLATYETVGTVHGNGADGVLSQVLGNLEDESAALGLGLALGELDFESVQDRGEVVRVEVDVDDGTNDGLDGTGLKVGGGGVRAGGSGY
jgi:peptide chain release factor 1